MKKLFTLVLTTFALLLQTSLHAQNTGSPAIENMNAQLPGTWEWTESRFASRGVKPTLKTPASEKTAVAVTFRSGNMATLYINKALIGTYQYTLTQPMNEYVLISFKPNEGQPLPEFLQEGPLTITGNVMHIAGGYNDAGLNVTFRKNAMATPAKTPEATKKTKTKKKAAAPKKQKTETKTVN